MAPLARSFARVHASAGRVKPLAAEPGPDARGWEMPIDRSQYVKGQFMVGQAEPGGFVTVEDRARVWVGSQPPPVEHKLPTPKFVELDERIERLKA